jgi:KDO2-lipid IV(A) lauroyltransferase
MGRATIAAVPPTPLAIRLRNSLIHGFTYLVLGAVRILPEQWSYAMGRGIALTAWTLFRGWRRTANRNLELFYHSEPLGQPQARSERLRIGRLAAISLGLTVIEFMRQGMLPLEQALKMVVVSEGDDNLQAVLAAARSAGTGVICASMHNANWEINGAYISQRITPLHAVGKEQRDEFFTRIAFPWRAKYGIRNIYAGQKAQSTILRVLREGGLLGLVADQNGGKAGLFAPFAGIQASTAVGVAALALKTGAPIIVTYCQRLAPGKLKIHILPPLDLSGLPADKQQAMVEILTRLNAAYEAIIRADPTQWLWGHKRWKTRPPGEPTLYW